MKTNLKYSILVMSIAIFSINSVAFELSPRAKKFKEFYVQHKNDFKTFRTQGFSAINPGDFPLPDSLISKSSDDPDVLKYKDSFMKGFAKKKKTKLVFAKHKKKKNYFLKVEKPKDFINKRVESKRYSNINTKEHLVKNDYHQKKRIVERTDTLSGCSSNVLYFTPSGPLSEEEVMELKTASRSPNCF